MSAVSEWCRSAKYDRPAAYYSIAAIVGFMMLLAAFLNLPDSPMLGAMGITGAQKRVLATVNGIYWSARASVNQTGSVEHIKVYGNMHGVDPTGKLVVSIAERDKWIKRSLAFANTEIIDKYVVAQIVDSLRTENARFDIYSSDRVVVWIRNVPLNVKLIEAGVARPESNPLTNIFDLAFATYYWSIAMPHQNAANLSSPSVLRNH